MESSGWGWGGRSEKRSLFSGPLWTSLLNGLKRRWFQSLYLVLLQVSWTICCPCVSWAAAPSPGRHRRVIDSLHLGARRPTIPDLPETFALTDPSTLRSYSKHDYFCVCFLRTRNNREELGLWFKNGKWNYLKNLLGNVPLLRRMKHFIICFKWNNFAKLIISWCIYSNNLIIYCWLFPMLWHFIHNCSFVGSWLQCCSGATWWRCCCVALHVF